MEIWDDDSVTRRDRFLEKSCGRMIWETFLFAWFHTNQKRWLDKPLHNQEHTMKKNTSANMWTYVNTARHIAPEKNDGNGSH